MFEAEFVNNPEEYIPRVDHPELKRRTGHRKNAARAYNYNEFISFDGEGTIYNEPTALGSGGHINPDYYKEITENEKFGKIVFHSAPGTVDSVIHNHKSHPQPYVLLGNSKGERVTRQKGLDTIECLEFLLNSKVMHPDSIFVGFYLNYDINQILKDIPEPKLWRLHDQGKTRYRKYWIEWMPKKWFNVHHKPSGRKMIIYDTSGFFQKSFLQTCIDYIPDDPRLKLIQQGKEARDLFTWEELDDFIIPYNNAEMSMHVTIMDILREDLHSVDAIPSKWYGPGAVANKVFNTHKVSITRETPEEVLDATQFAYAGGRFELLRMGRYPHSIYEYDIHSAYPAAAATLPDFSQGVWETVSTFEPFSIGLWHIQSNNISEDWDRNNRPQPLFCRSSNGSISYPNEVEGWYWTPEARFLPDTDIREGYVFRPATSNRPFAFVEAMYNDRRILKSQGSSSERALKLILNSLYGKTAQTVGGKDGPPIWHQLEYAGYITSYTRAKIYEAVLQNPDAIIATETDAVFSTAPLDLPLTDELGDWELKGIYDEICYLQSGFYYYIHNGETKCRYRGMDKDKNTGLPLGLPYEDVLEALARDRSVLRGKTKRFIGLALGLQTKSVWRSWEPKDHLVYLYSQNSKRIHNRETCAYCDAGITMYNQLHPLEIGGYSGKSYARSIPWRSVGGPEATTIDWDEWREMDPSLRNFGEDMDRWQ